MASVQPAAGARPADAAHRPVGDRRGPQCRRCLDGVRSADESGSDGGPKRSAAGRRRQCCRPGAGPEFQPQPPGLADGGDGLAVRHLHPGEPKLPRIHCPAGRP